MVAWLLASTMSIPIMIRPLKRRGLPSEFHPSSRLDLSLESRSGALAEEGRPALQWREQRSFKLEWMDYGPVHRRHLEEDVKARLKRRAARHGRSMEEEVRHILRDAVKEQNQGVVKLGSRIAARFAEAGLTAELPELHGQVPQSEKFGKRLFSIPMYWER
jgi:plasmid stability protein